MGTEGFSPERIAHHVLDALLEGCQVVDVEGRYLYVNEAAARQGQRSPEELVGRRMTECYPGIEKTLMYSTLQHSLRERVRMKMLNEFTFPDGGVGWFELRFVPVPEGVCILSLDVTEDRRAASRLVTVEERLRQTQKLEAIGSLAAGIAHDFNNLLSVVLGYTALAIDDLGESDPLRANLEEVQRAGARAAEMTRQLLAFGRVQLLRPRRLDLAHVVTSMQPMLARLLGEQVEVVVSAAPSLGTVHADPTQIEQVVLNLAINGRDAMPEGGRLRVDLSNARLEADYAAEHPGVEPGSYVLLAVTDEGPGLDARARARVFEPFYGAKGYGAKGRGPGAGLGLATVFGIVTQSGGHVAVQSEPGKGSSFEVYLPRNDAHLPEIDMPPTPLGSLRGSETVLLVEDEEPIRVLARAILRRSGYNVLEAHDGEEALVVADGYPATIHLLVTDVVMPRMGGRKLAARLAATRPAMRVLYMSGYGDDGGAAPAPLEPEAVFLAKPLTPDGLLRKLREALATPG